MPNLWGVISDYFWEEEALKIPEKIWSMGFVSRARLLREKDGSNYEWIFFAKKWPKKVRMFNITFHCLSFEPGQDPISVPPRLDPDPYKPILRSTQPPIQGVTDVFLWEPSGLQFKKTRLHLVASKNNFTFSVVENYFSSSYNFTSKTIQRLAIKLGTNF
jgi:hypothetical protein